MAAACQTLKKYVRQCGKNAKAGVNPDVYLVAYDDLVLIEGSTEVYTESATGLITAIGVGATAKFVKYGTALKQGSITENFTHNDNGTFDIVKALIFTINNMGSVDSRTAVEDLIGQPIAALVRLNSGSYIAVGLNGQFQLTTSVGTVDETNNGRVVTLQGSDSVLVQPVDPTIIASIVAA